MTPNDLIKVLDRGYADGKTGLVVANWVPGENGDGKLSAKPYGDTVAYAVATVVSDAKVSGWFGPEKPKTEIDILANVLEILGFAMSDLHGAYDRVDRLLMQECLIVFFEMLQAEPLLVTQDLVYVWRRICPEQRALGMLGYRLTDAILAQVEPFACSPTSEDIAQILTGLRAELDVLLDRKQPESVAPAAPVAATVPAAEPKK